MKRLLLALLFLATALALSPEACLSRGLSLDAETSIVLVRSTDFDGNEIEILGLKMRSFPADGFFSRWNFEKGDIIWSINAIGMEATIKKEEFLNWIMEELRKCDSCVVFITRLEKGEFVQRAILCGT